MSIIDFFKKLFPFLVSAAEKTFDQLEEAAKEAGINGSLFAQIIKDNVEAADADVKNLIKSKLNLDDDLYAHLESELRSKYKIPAALDVIKFLQSKFYDTTDEILHSSLANEVASVAAIILSKGKLTWLTLLAGVGEFIYRKFVKGSDVSVKDGGFTTQGTCPQGYYWDETTKQCVKDRGGNP